MACGSFRIEIVRAETPVAIPIGRRCVCRHLKIEIVKRSDQAKGFAVLPRRWVVELTFAWLNRCRRLAKDFENLTRNALAFLRLASICLMLEKALSDLTNFSDRL